MIKFFYLSFLGLLLTLSSLEAKRSYGDLVVSKVNRVYDGDTFMVEIEDVHPLIGQNISVRIQGIDTPEITDKRESVQAKAKQARFYVIERLEHAQSIELKNIQRDKYFRLLAEVYVDGANLAQELLSKGLAQSYEGKTKPIWE